MTEQPHLIGGRYELGELLGRGGMAEVREARDIRLGRLVAIKRLRSDLASDATFQARFKREAQSAASLNHPTIVAVYDTGEEQLDGQSVPYIVMEHVEGQTLRDLLRSGEELLPERALEIVAGVLRALSYSHHAGIVHRDIKPANVMLTPIGDVKVMDFGIARAIADTSATVTQTAAVIGTAQYLSPEQARGAQVDARSDLYSTGCLLYELLTGRPPFIGDSPVSVAYQHVREEPEPPSTVKPGLSPTIDAVVLRSLAKSPDDRYQSADDMRDDIERAMRGERTAAPATVVVPQATQMFPVTQPPTSQVGYAPVRTERRVVEEYDDDDDRRGGSGWLIGILAVILLGALGFIAFQLLTNENTGDEEPPDAGSELIELTGIVGLTVDDAAIALEADGFTLTQPCDEVADEEAPAGQIIEQNPEAGTESAPDTAVSCVVSTGPAAPDEVVVPQLVNLTEDQAVDAILGVGLTLGDSTPLDGPTEAGIVLESAPAQGETVEADTTVDLTVSSGQNAVPPVVELPQAEAEAALRDAGFNPVPSQEESDAEPGTVIDQQPAAETVADVGSDVAIVVAAEPPPELVAVPDVSSSDLTFAQADTRLSESGFTDVTISTASDQPCRNNPSDQCRVVAQDPPAGTEFEDPAAQPVELTLQQLEGDDGRAPVRAATLPGALALLLAGHRRVW